MLKKSLTIVIWHLYIKIHKNKCISIALDNVIYKILSYCILDRVKPFAKKIIGEYQCGFRSNKSAIDQIFVRGELF